MGYRILDAAEATFSQSWMQRQIGKINQNFGQVPVTSSTTNTTANGATSGSFYSGSGAPSAKVGQAGDVYLDTVGKALYVKSATAWGAAIAL